MAAAKVSRRGCYLNHKELEMIENGKMVYLVSDPAKRGIVISSLGEGENARYQIFIDNGPRTFFAEQICEVGEVVPQRVGREAFLAYLTSCLIEKPSAQNLYSLNAARIDFVPYQFRPVLKMLKSDEKRLLIADSVGVGKTIEAGLIIKELEAHGALARVAIICPKPLVAEKKWENEMRDRFEEDFTALDGVGLREAIVETDREGEWPQKLGRVIIPYSILDERAWMGQGKKGIGLKSIEKDLDFDLVIVDEAHHIRNGSDRSEKHFAYKCVKVFCERAKASVMLTATPIQNKSHDLFVLLNVLRPDIILDEASFNYMDEPNVFINRIARLVRSAGVGWREKARGEMESIERTKWGRDYIAANPTFKKCRGLLERDEELTGEERIDFLSAIESLHSFSNMINRTQRRDIGDFCVRQPQAVRVEMTDVQERLFQALINFEHRALAQLHGERWIKFMMTTIMRQAASCVFGLAPYLDDILEWRLSQFPEAVQEEAEGGGWHLTEATRAEIYRLSQEVRRLAKELPRKDFKIEALIEVLRERQGHAKNKVMVFSSFLSTLDYVGEHLEDAGFRIGRIDGSVGDEERRSLRARFMREKGDAQAIDVLLFSEVGSEGLDYQFCDMMVNYDLPWNPMAIEQRIGRIDRRGQTSEIVHIVNLLTKGTIDETIYDRCLEKLGVFETSLGDCEEILGTIEDGITKIVLDDALTKEKREEKLAQLADNAIRKRQEELKLEKEQHDLFGLDVDALRDNESIREAQSPWLSEKCIEGLVQFYLNEKLGKKEYISCLNTTKMLRLSREAKDRLLEDLRAAKLPRSATMLEWQNFLKGDEQWHVITFNKEELKEKGKAFFCTPTHPLVKVAARFIAEKSAAGMDVPHLALRAKVDGVGVGEYSFAVYGWNVNGFNSQFKMVVVASDERLEKVVPKILQTEGAIEDAEVENDARLDVRHQELWRKEKDRLVQDVRSQAEYKREAVQTSFARQKKSIENQIEKCVDEQRKRMLEGKLESARERMESKIREVNEIEKRADITTQLFAYGKIYVED
jgi:ATP-dependent helicase HepA